MLKNSQREKQKDNINRVEKLRAGKRQRDKKADVPGETGYGSQKQELIQNKVLCPKTLK